MFTSDVIYHLKHEYGERIIVKRDTVSTNYTTGAKTSDSEIFIIQNAILLPLDKRFQFLRSLGVQKLGYLEPGEREFLIDKDDLEFEIKLNDQIIDDHSAKYQVSREPENARDYVTVTAKELAL